MQIEKEEKQRYLTEHILNNEYDAEDFLDYCYSVLGNADLDSWSFKDLENIVTSYLKSKKISENQPNPHETSYIDYEQEKHMQEPQTPPSPPVKMTRPASPVRQIYIEPKKGSKKDVFKADIFDNPPSPVRIPANQNIVKLAPQQKITLDQVFKDPFKKPIKPIKPTNDFNNIWGQTSDTKPPIKFDNEIKFDSILLTNPADFNSFKQTNKSKATIVTQIQDTPTSESKSIKKQKEKEKSKQKYVQKQKQQKPTKEEKAPIGNKQIFDIDFTDISDVHANKKSSPHLTSKLPKQDAVSSSLGQKLQVPKSPKQSFKNNYNSTKSAGGAKSSSPTTPPVNLYASVTPNVNQSRKKAKAEGTKVVQEDWYDIVKCVKAKTRQLALKPNLEIVITGHEIVNRNVFMPDYVRYFVSTPAINSEVKRKYNHFVKLRTYLQKFYPGFRLPYLSKSAWFQQTDPNNIAAQKFMITHFMNDVLMNREIRNCRIVDEFLTLKDYKGLKVKFQEYQKMGALHSIQQLCLLQGQISVGYSEDHRVYIEKIPQMVSSIEGVFQKYKKLLEQLTHNHQALQKTLSDLSETTNTMEGLIKNFNSSVDIGECKQLESTLKLINKMYKQLDKQSKFDMDLIQSELKPIFKYQKQNIGTIKQVLSTKLKFQESFNPNNKIQRKQKQTYTNQGLQQYKIKINEASKNATVLRYQHGYYSNQTVNEFKRMLTNLSDKLSNKFGQYCHEYHQRLVEYSGFWNNLKSAISLPVFE